ncbi:hypothetical protein [Neisseria uirgultaei]|uniref:hypothetical protein n=1 Tax=Neisseria uirgultaei TaxID=2830646 RepID=UPI0019023932|nr:hypothetical protein [Neisseria uirgultaei]
MPSEGFRRHLCRRDFRAVSVCPSVPRHRTGRAGSFWCGGWVGAGGVGLGCGF